MISGENRSLRLLLFWILLFVWRTQCIEKLHHGLTQKPSKNSFQTNQVNIVSVLDASSFHSTILKIHSIVQSSLSPSNLRFYFLLFPQNKPNPLIKSSSSLSVNYFEKVFTICFPDIIAEFRYWNSSSFLSSHLQGEKFDTEIIFSRVYLPKIYSFLPRFIYLDNDVIVTRDLLELLNYPLIYRRKELLLARQVLSNETIQIFRPEVQANSSRDQNPPIGFDTFPAAFGMVYETSNFYSLYLSKQYNQGHSLVQEVQKNVQLLYPFPMGSGRYNSSLPHPGYTFFPNSGVIVFDTIQWNSFHLTEKAEEIIRRNVREKIYSTAAGDQAIFYLFSFALHAFHDDHHQQPQQQQSSSIPKSQENAFFYAFLPPQFNMRRSPKKAFQLVGEGVLGIIHFAGMTHANPFLFCENPHAYPLLYSTNVLPLYFSVALSLQRHLRSLLLQMKKDEGKVAETGTSPGNLSLQQLLLMLAEEFQVCRDQVPVVQKYLDEHAIAIKYDPGPGNFSWPPL